LKSRNAYFGAFSGPPQSDSVVLAGDYGIFGGRAISNIGHYYDTAIGLTNS